MSFQQLTNLKGQCPDRGLVLLALTLGHHDLGLALGGGRQPSVAGFKYY